MGWTCGAHLLFCFEETLYRTFHRCYLLYQIRYSVSEEKIFCRNNQKRIAYGGHICKPIVMKWAISIEDLPQILPTKFRFAKWFQRRRFFRNRPIRNKNCLWWPCLLTDQDEMSNLNRETFIDTSYQVSVPLAKRFQRRIFFSSNCLAKWTDNLVGSIYGRSSINIDNFVTIS